MARVNVSRTALGAESECGVRLGWRSGERSRRMKLARYVERGVCCGGLLEMGTSCVYGCRWYFEDRKRRQEEVGV